MKPPKTQIVFFVSVWLLLIFGVVCDESPPRARAKRYVVFPVGAGTFKLIVGLGIPTKLGIRQSMAVGMNFQFQYRVPEKLADLEKPYPPIIAKARERRSPATATAQDRALFYLGLAAAMSRNGTNGEACVLRSICDNAMHPLKHQANGIFGELMHIALTPAPSQRWNEPEADGGGGGDAYVAAQRAGEFGVDCASLYPACPAGANLLDTLSVLDN